MIYSYKPLWKKLIDKDMSKKSLMDCVGISKSTVDKMNKNLPISLTLIAKICEYFDCGIEEIIEIKRGENE